MTPWPKNLQERFPAAPGCLPDRPWWRTEVAAHTIVLDRLRATTPPRYIRLDGKRLSCSMPDAWNEIGYFDKHNPLPHPGLRTGQVWARDDGESVQIVSSIGPLFVGYRAIPSGLDTPPMSIQGAYAFDGKEFPYLIADPCCPWLAPWSPS